MKAVSKILAAGAGIAALASAAPAAAQYYPGTGYGGGYNTGGIIGVIDQLLRGSRYGYNSRVNGQALVQQCTAAVQQRLSGRYNGGYGGYDGGYGGYGGGYGGYGNPYGAYGGGGYGGGQVLSVYHADRHGSTIRVRGYASSSTNAGAGGYGGYGGYGAYGGGYAAPVADLKFRCDIDFYGRIRNIDIDRNRDLSYRH